MTNVVILQRRAELACMQFREGKAYEVIFHCYIATKGFGHRKKSEYLQCNITFL